MTSFKVTCSRLARLMVFGFHGTHGRQMKRFVLCQWILFALFVFVWYKINRGLWPRFLQPDPGMHGQVALDVNLIDHFLSAQHDGSLVTWTHAANSRDLLKQALSSDVMMIEADVILRGQNTANQEMTPIMASLSNITSDLTLAEWLTLVKGRGKGLKIDFKSIEAVEISLQKLQEIKHELNAPLHLSAAVLSIGSGDEPTEKPVDPNRFLRLCTTHVPGCTLALGWVSSPGSLRYNWTAVKSMCDLIERWHVKQPVTFNVQLHIARHSMPQLKWLMEMCPASTLTVISSAPLKDTKFDDLAYIRRSLPQHSVFYDIARDVRVEFNSLRDELVQDRQDSFQMDEAHSFVADQWKIVRSQGGEIIYLGTSAVLLQTGVLLTKVEYPASPQKPVTIVGRVEFVPESVADNSDVNEQQEEIGLAVFLHASQSSRPDSLSGIRCFFGVKGEIRIEARRIPGAEAQAQTVLPGASPCIAFKITDNGIAGIIANVVRPRSCDSNFDLETDVDFEAKVELPMKDVHTEKSFVAIKQTIPVGFTAIDRFTIHTRH